MLEKLRNRARATNRARRGSSCVLQLPLDSAVPWKPEILDFWKDFGGRSDAPVSPAVLPPELAHLSIRAVRIRPAVVSRLRARDPDIVLACPVLDSRSQFDLIVATNILVYYDSFQQSLAPANIERLLRPGGFFLCNNALLELPSSRIRSVGYLTTQYSERPDDGDHIVWYQRQRDRVSSVFGFLADPGMGWGGLPSGCHETTDSRDDSSQF